MKQLKQLSQNRERIMKQNHTPESNSSGSLASVGQGIFNQGRSNLMKDFRANQPIQQPDQTLSLFSGEVNNKSLESNWQFYDNSVSIVSPPKRIIQRSESSEDSKIPDLSLPSQVHQPSPPK